MIVIVDYGLGNLGSIANMLKKIGVNDVLISSDKSEISMADKLILPGVGAFDQGMKSLAEKGLVEVVNQKVLGEKTPVLGLCLGMQLFTLGSEEGKLPGLGWLDAVTVRYHFDGKNNQLRIPHMGWNTIEISSQHPLFNNMDSNARFYFVHSYYVICNQPELVLAKTHYGFPFASIIGKDHILGVQFHPEKSHKFGMSLLQNFVDLSI